MTAKRLSAKYGVNVMRMDHGKNAFWCAFLGGNGTGSPVIEIAHAYNLAHLEVLITRELNRKPK